MTAFPLSLPLPLVFPLWSTVMEEAGFWGSVSSWGRASYMTAGSTKNCLKSWAAGADIGDGSPKSEKSLLSSHSWTFR